MSRPGSIVAIIVGIVTICAWLLLGFMTSIEETSLDQTSSESASGEPALVRRNAPAIEHEAPSDASPAEQTIVSGTFLDPDHKYEPSRLGSIGGRVIDASTHECIPNCKVTVFLVMDGEARRYSGGRKRTTTTNARGEFKVGEAGTGRYYIYAESPGYYPEFDLDHESLVAEYITREIDGKKDSARVFPEIDPGQHLEGMEIKLARGLTQHGRTVDPDGRILPGIEVHWRVHGKRRETAQLPFGPSVPPTDRRLAVYMTTVSDSEGNFTLTSIPHGIDISFEATHKEFPVGAHRIIPAADVGKDILLLQLDRGIKLSGVVLGPKGPLQHYEVRVDDPFYAKRQGRQKLTAFTDKYGRYQLNGLTSGDTIVELMTNLQHGEFTVTGGARRKIYLVPGRDHVHDFILDYKAAVTGRVVDHNGKAVAHAWVVVTAINGINIPTDQLNLMAETDREGKFRLMGLSESASYRVQAWVHGRYKFEPNNSGGSVAVDVDWADLPKAISATTIVRSTDSDIEFIVDTSGLKK